MSKKPSDVPALRARLKELPLGEPDDSLLEAFDAMSLNAAAESEASDDEEVSVDDAARKPRSGPDHDEEAH